MFNLIKRDLIIQKVQLVLFVPCITFLILIGSHLPDFYIFMFAGIFIPINAYSYDEQAETNILLNSLPYTRKQIIASRYIGAIFYMALSIGLASTLFYLFGRSFMLTDIAIGAAITFILFAFTFPLFYLLKPGYIGTVILVGIVLITILSPHAVTFLQDYLIPIVHYLECISTSTLYLGSAGFIVIVYTVSWLFSQTVYQRKAF